MKTANDNLGDIPSIGEARNRVQQHLLGLTGDGRLRQSSDLIFAEPKFDKVVATLRALVGSFGPVEVTESGLGYSNLLYMSVLLAALEEETEAALRLLLIEEPEAHLHPQLQDLLMRFLEKTGSAGSQVVITTHSPNLASGAKVERLTVLSRRAADMTLVGRCVGDFGLAPTHLEHLRRFLDVTKSGLLFARGVILVEGIAEQLLVPVIAERLGISLTQAGIAVVNVGGIAFRPFIELFGDDKLPFPCAVISDSDPTNDDVQDEDEESDVSSNSSEEASAAVVDGQGGQPQPIEADGAVSGSTTSEADTESESAITEADQEAAANLSPAAKILRGLENEHLKVFLADRTLEWDLVRVGNWNVLLDALKRVKPRVAARLRRDHADSAPEARADVLLDKVKDRKGRFAQELAAIIGEAPEFEVPGYIRQAIDWVSRDDFGGSEPTQDDGPDLPRPEAEDDSAQGPDDVLDAPT